MFSPWLGPEALEGLDWACPSWKGSQDTCLLALCPCSLVILFVLSGEEAAFPAVEPEVSLLALRLHSA